MIASDEILMTRFSRGDEAAFLELVNRYQRKLLNFIFRRTGCREMAEDLVQETFLRVVNAAPRYQATAKFTTWLYTIALNLWRNEVSRRSLKTCVVDDNIPSSSMDVEMALDFKHLQTLMQTLSEEHCLVLELGFIEGWTNQQIADLTGCTVGTVKSRKFYALKALRKHMGITNDEPMSGTATAI